MPSCTAYRYIPALHSCVQEEFQFYMEDAQSKLLVVVS